MKVSVTKKILFNNDFMSTQLKFESSRVEIEYKLLIGFLNWVCG